MERFETLRREKEVFNPSPEQNRDLQVRIIAQLAVPCLTRDYKRLIEPHIESFNYFLLHGLDTAVRNLGRRSVVDSLNNRIECTSLLFAHFFSLRSGSRMCGISLDQERAGG
mgnify:CR=1 FL=1